MDMGYQHPQCACVCVCEREREREQERGKKRPRSIIVKSDVSYLQETQTHPKRRELTARITNTLVRDLGSTTHGRLNVNTLISCPSSGGWWDGLLGLNTHRCTRSGLFFVSSHICRGPVPALSACVNTNALRELHQIQNTRRLRSVWKWMFDIGFKTTFELLRPLFWFNCWRWLKSLSWLGWKPTAQMRPAHLWNQQGAITVSRSHTEGWSEQLWNRTYQLHVRSVQHMEKEKTDWRYLLTINT